MTKRRGNGEGSIYQRESDGRWVASLRLPNGKRKSFYGKTRKEAQDKLRGAVRDLDHGIDLSQRGETVGAFLDRWLEDVARPGVRTSTFDSYAMHVRLHLKPAVGHIKLRDLTPAHVQRLLNEKSKAGLSPNSVRLLRATLRRALSYAVKWSVVSRNVASLVDPPRVVQKPVAPLTAEQLRILLDFSRSHRLGPLIHVAAATGMRQGELLGLRWGDADLEMGTVRVRYALQRIDGRPTFVEPKTDRSRREIPLPQSATLALREQKDRLVFQRVVAGDRWTEIDLVFPSTIGTPLNSSNVTHQFQQILAAAGLPRQRFHDLRHGYATLLLQQNVSPRVVMENMGHSQIGLTMNTYSHVIPSAQRAAADRLDELLTGSEG